MRRAYWEYWVEFRATVMDQREHLGTTLVREENGHSHYLYLETEALGMMPGTPVAPGSVIGVGFRAREAPEFLALEGYLTVFMDGWIHYVDVKSPSVRLARVIVVPWKPGGGS